MTSILNKTTAPDLMAKGCSCAIHARREREGDGKVSARRDTTSSTEADERNREPGKPFADLQAGRLMEFCDNGGITKAILRHDDLYYE